MTAIQMPSRLREALIDEARAAAPEEACGLLLGQGASIRAIAPLANRAEQPRRRYRADPLEYMRAERAAEARGLAVLGVWHSHPASRAVPSGVDRRDAWPGWLYVIIGLAPQHGPEVRAWRRRADGFREQVIQEEVSTP